MHIYTQATLYWSLHITEANEPSGWNDRLWAHHLICLLTCLTSGTMAVLLTGTASSILPTKSQLTPWNNTPDEAEHKIITGERHLEAVFQVIVTDHS